MGEPGNVQFATERKPSTRSFPWRPLILILVMIAVLVLAKVFGLGARMKELREWIVTRGVWGPFLFVAIYVLATVAALPGSALTVVAGSLFGSVLGVVCVSVGSTLGAALAFLIGRYFARDTIEQWLFKHEKFRRLNELTERHGALVVALTRLGPIVPFNLLNYGLGLTRVSFWTYLFWSWLCMFPATVLYVVGTDALLQGLIKKRIPWALVGVTCVSAVILVVVIRYARWKLQGRESEE